MPILLAATPMPGHLNPVLTAARLLVAAWNEVVVTPGLPSIAALGVTILPLHRDDGAPIGPGLPPARDADTIASKVGGALIGSVPERVKAILTSLARLHCRCPAHNARPHRP